VDPVKQALIAVRNQDWNEALEILRSADHMDMEPEDRATVLKVRAAALTRRGQWRAAQDDYLQLRRLYPADTDLQLEVLLGLADCYNAVGDWSTAKHLLQSALDQLADADVSMHLRVKSMYLHTLSRFDAEGVVDSWKQLLAQPGWPQGADLATARFWEGEAYWQLGRYEDAMASYDLAHELAMAYDATRTEADCTRRRVLGQLFTDDKSWIYGIKELKQATEWYEMIGDRSCGHTNSELGEIYKHLGQLVEAERAFTRGIVLMEHANENVRAAHNHLGLADVHRLQLRKDKALEQCDLARMLYRRLEHPWGIIWSSYLAWLLDDPWPSNEEWKSERWYDQIAQPERELLRKLPKRRKDQPLMLRYVD
jgi:tetratricopeptide (TPR) repeat protein